MPSEPTTNALRELLVHQLESWLPAARHRSRRATVALAYAHRDVDSAEAALRLVAGQADRLPGFRLTVLVLADAAADLPARLGPIEAGLPADVAVHVVPGDPSRLPVALKAAGAAGAPLFSFVDAGTGAAGAPDAAVLRAAAGGRPAEVLLRAGRAARAALDAVGFPLVTQVDLAAADGPAESITFGTGSDRSLEAFKEALWAAADLAAVRLGDPAGPPWDVAGEPELDPLGRELVAELARGGPRTVTELRRHALLATVHRSSDALRALTDLLAAGAVTRDPAEGRLGGDVIISPSAGASA
ncbi:hypothetical protein E1211_26000 [Micromonospora sp. 15K316]|uniref:hypothetical protein n=1 Tax=Micromonospora sp. 15K316 TaxID=2530376 RepID=UPI0010534BB4|nr:hypothetical protein [Micromonospora sp. 15K316]TDC29482.1 hypothetical protein E1211_26000 [Micromonospora sp. 15K316]